MLNIPNNISELLKTDGVKKNLRIHFPNGELPDITNDHILADSLEFTESVCSAKTLQLGLAESSVLSFYCADLPNFRGATIEAYIEVENNGSYYPIPLGVFTVDECRRQKDLITRKVVAYSYANVVDPTIPAINGRKNYIYSFEGARRMVPVYSDSPFESQLRKWIVSMFSRRIDPHDTLLPKVNTYPVTSPLPTYVSGQIKLPNSVYSISIAPLSNYIFFFKNPGGTTTGSTFKPSDIPWLDSAKLYAYRSEKSLSEKLDAINEAIAGRGSIDKNDIESWFEQFTIPACTELIYRRKGSSTNAYNEYHAHPAIEKEGYIYQHTRGVHSTATSYSGYTALYVANRVSVSIYKHGDFLERVTVDLGGIDLYEVDTTNYSAADNILISIPRKKYSSTDYRTELPDDFNVYDLTRSYSELSANFGMFDRTTGLLQFKEIGQGGEFSVDASKISDIEYDEEQAIYTSVHAAYTVGSTTDEYVKEIDVGRDNNPYIINSNYLMNNGYLTAAQVQAFTDQIAAKLSTYKYVPCNITMVGAPQMEAGDILHITLNDGTQMDIPVLRRTLRGIQVLEDVIDIL
ncbi:MAG: hypothetical protein MJZ26_12270 [Fibrobacter sp.]|nr:hypothetical protein [Fibrobacter sp.]